MVNDFKKHLIANVDKYKTEKLNSLRRTHEMLKQPAYEQFTNNVFLAIGHELETFFPTLDFRLVQRFKTDYSFENKYNQKINKAYSQNHRIDDIDNVKLKDSIGYEIIIENIPDNFLTNNQTFDKALRKLLKKRKNAYDELEQLKGKYDDFLQKYQDYHSIDPNFDEVYQTAKAGFENQITAAENYYLEKKDHCELELASFIITYLSENSQRMHYLGIQSVPNTLKEHNERYLDYRATHNCIEVQDKNSPHNGWIAEIQGKSSYRHSVGEEGIEGHITRFSKNRVLPKLDENNLDEFYKAINKVVPKYKLYIKDGLAYELSPLESFIHYFRIDLMGNEGLKRPAHPEYFEKVIKVLSDERKKIEFER